MNVKASNTAVELALEEVTYAINNKPTVNFVEVILSQASFIKEWYDTENFHELNCANRHYLSSINDAVIDRAQRVDSR